MGSNNSKESLREILIKISKSLENISHALGQINDPQPRKPIWKRAAIILPLLGILLLFVIDFPTQSKSKADLVVLEDTEIWLVIKPEPNWKALNLPPNPEYRKIPDRLSPNSSLTSVLQVELFKQGWRYKHTAIRVMRTKEGLKADISGQPISIKGPTKLIISPMGELDYDYKAMANSIVRNYALKIGKMGLPLLAFVITPDLMGHLVIETKPKIGFSRFKGNFEKVFNLIF